MDWRGVPWHYGWYHDISTEGYDGTFSSQTLNELALFDCWVIKESSVQFRTIQKWWQFSFASLPIWGILNWTSIEAWTYVFRENGRMRYAKSVLRLFPLKMSAVWPTLSWSKASQNIFGTRVIIHQKTDCQCSSLAILTVVWTTITQVRHLPFFPSVASLSFLAHHRRLHLQHSSSLLRMELWFTIVPYET